MPRKLAHYELLDRIGKGGMGEVHRARDSRLEREVAIKALPEDFSRDADRAARFRREAKMLASLNHPGIAAIYGLETEDDREFLIMELVEGEDLTRHLESGPLPIATAVDVAEQIAAALSYAHAQGIVHRDLKPANVRLTADGVVKVLDFGLARAFEAAPASGQAVEDSDTVETPLTGAHVVLGTPQYMSPEQATASPHVDHRSDIYSLGCLVFEMLTGKPPYTAPDAQSILAQHATARIPDASTLRPEAPGAVRKVLAKAMAKIPDDRYDSAEAFAAELRVALLGKPTSVRRSRVLVATVVTVMVVGALAGALWVSQRGARRQTWIHETAIPAIRQAIEDRDRERAMELAREIDAIDPGNEQLAALYDSFSRSIEIRSEPEGAAVYRRPLDPAGAEGESAASPDRSGWERLGVTPVEVRIPSGFQRFRFEKEGYTPAEIASHWYYLRDQVTRLGIPGETPEDMVFIPGGTTSLNIPGLDHLAAVDLGSYLIGKTEVTNAGYARFVDAGGYENPAYWTEPFVLDGSTLSFDEAMARFTDRTGQRGPSTWEAGDHPDGLEDHPVGGISWFEAAAFAAFAERALPTVHHWNRAAETRISHIVVPGSNFDGKGTAPVGSYPGMTAFGVLDMAGNVREWCANATAEGNRVILGGGWNDLTYMFNDFYAQDPWDRSETNGVRTALFPEPFGEAASDPVVTPHRDFMAETPVSDEVFAVYRNLFRYDRGELDPEITSTDDSSDDFIAERVDFNAAYGGERMTAIVYTPKGGTPPYPAVVIFPGSNAIHAESSTHLMQPWTSWLMKRGYAAILPIYKGTYERGTELDSDYASETQDYLDHLVWWGKDLSRSIDYLESRPEFDTTRLGYLGTSWGGAMGPIMLAIEPRFDAGVLYVAGLMVQRARPEADAINYVSRVTIPVLMLNGKYDHFFPVESSQIPLYELLGTPPEHKKHYLYEDGHSVPRPDVIRETLGWFDRYLTGGA